jgi:hypothetical protein
MKMSRAKENNEQRNKRETGRKAGIQKIGEESKKGEGKETRKGKESRKKGNNE